MSFLESVSPSLSVAALPGLSGGPRDCPREPDSGRERTEPAPREVGLCCQDKVPLRDRAVALVGGKDGDSGFSEGG